MVAEVVEFAALEMLRSHLGMVLGNLLRVALLQQGLGQVTSGGPCQPHPLHSHASPAFSSWWAVASPSLSRGGITHLSEGLGGS